MKKLSHVSNLYHSKQHVALAEMLVKHSCLNKVFLCNSGTEANEAALKFAKLYGNARGKKKIIAFKNGFHGRSMGALSLTYKPSIQEPFMPLLGNIEFSNFNDVKDFEAKIDHDVAAVFMEPMQGEGGMYPAH